jgi:aspartyl protease family protein
MARWKAGCLILIIALAGAASADIYRWTDESGKLHFAQSLQQVPARYRQQVTNGAANQTGGSFQTYAADPEQRAVRRSNSFRIPFQRDGSLMRVHALVNDHLDVGFLIDTGASGVSLPTATARRLGILVGPDTPRISVRTANGTIQVPLVRLDSVVLGGARVEGLMATVNPTMNIGLLGGAFFNHFSYEVDPAASVITLKPNHAVVSGLGEQHWQRRFLKIRGPLAELEDYLRDREGLRAARREELEQKRAELQAGLNALEIEANRDDVPAAWRR